MFRLCRRCRPEPYRFDDHADAWRALYAEYAERLFAPRRRRWFRR